MDEKEKRRFDMTRFKFGLMAMAFIAVTMAFAPTARAGDCPFCETKFTVHTGPAWDNCVDTYCATKKKKKKKVVVPEVPVEVVIETNPCPYFMGREMSKEDCPDGCPDPNNMRVNGNICQCSKENMAISANGMTCQCQNGMIMQDGKCVTPKTNCEDCADETWNLVLYGFETMVPCSSDGKYYSRSEYKSKCEPCPESTTDTGGKCIPKPEEESDFFCLPTMWDVIFFLLIIGGGVAAYFLRGRLGFVSKDTFDDLKKEFDDLTARSGASRLLDLDASIIPNLEEMLDIAKRAVKTAQAAKDQFDKAKQTLENAVTKAEEEIRRSTQAVADIDVELGPLESLTKPKAAQKRKITTLNKSKVACRADLTAAQAAKTRADAALLAFTANAADDLRKINEQIDLKQQRVDEVDVQLKDARDEAADLR